MYNCGTLAGYVHSTYYRPWYYVIPPVATGSNTTPWPIKPVQPKRPHSKLKRGVPISAELAAVKQNHLRPAPDQTVPFEAVPIWPSVLKSFKR